MPDIEYTFFTVRPGPVDHARSSQDMIGERCEYPAGTAVHIDRFLLVPHTVSIKRVIFFPLLITALECAFLQAQPAVHTFIRIDLRIQETA